MSGGNPPETGVVDARGLLCPWPALRLGRAARQAGGNGRIRIWVDDPMAAEDVSRYCTERGWTILPCGAQDFAFEVRIG